MSNPDENLIDIAVIGMSCRVAGANSPSELWDLLVSSRDVQREITRFNIDAFYQSDGGPRSGLTNVKDAYMLDDAKIDRFDHVFFQTTPVEAASMDPQQRMLLEIAYEAVENAGIPLDNFVGTNTAVFAGKYLSYKSSSKLLHSSTRNGRLRLPFYLDAGH
jgi:acyl transferase domain-containing protein